MTAKALEIVEEYLQDQGKSLQLLRQACAFEKSRYPLITRDDYLSSPFLGAFRQCQFILQIEAYYYAQNQKPEESLQSVNAMIALNRSLKSEPSAISQLIKMAFENELFRTLEYMFNIFALTEQQLNSIRVALEKCYHENNVTDTLISERALCHDHLQEVFQWPQSDKWKYLKLFYSWLGYSERQRILYLDQMEHYIKISEYPFPRRFLAIKDVHLKSMWSQEDYDFLEAVKWGNVELLQKESKNIAFYRLAQIALALERYRLAHNQLPISLSALIPDYLEDIPKDPYDGQNIRYMKIENGYKIYSVGDDCIDNKGKGELFPVLLTELEPGFDYVFTVQR